MRKAAARGSAGLLLGALLLTACAPRRATVVPNPEEIPQVLADYVDSGRYARDVEDAVAPAKAFLESHARGAKLAVVLDIDETALSNLPAERANRFAYTAATTCDLARGPCGLRAWQRMARAEAIAPVLDLDREARRLGYAVIFLSGRSEGLRAATEENLRKAGYAWDRLVLRRGHELVETATRFKSAERTKLEAEGFRIVESVGDQRSDLEGGHAERTFKLPNPFYFIP